MHFGNGRYCWLSTIWLPSRNHHLGSGSDFVTSDVKRPIIAQNDCTVISVHKHFLVYFDTHVNVIMYIKMVKEKKK